MTRSAREDLALQLELLEPEPELSAQVRVGTDALELEVAGLGPVALPVSADDARRLIALARPARYGRGERTLTDRTVRDTWEVPRTKVAVRLGATFDRALEELLPVLGLPANPRVKAELHSLLVYEPGQFFLPHQDSEKTDDMVATLVVMLPSAHSGGELVVHDEPEEVVHHGSRTKVTLVAFYADRRHEVRPVRSGYRVALTFNLLLAGDTTPDTPPDPDAVRAVADLLRRHFAELAATDDVQRLVYLLDHQYTERASTWTRLKGVDALRAALLRAAAEATDCEVMLALVDLQQTWDVFEEDAWDSTYRSGWDDEDDDEFEDDALDADSGGYVLNELIESETTLVAWGEPSAARLEKISLAIDDRQLCAAIPTEHLEPTRSEYEGYMGNYGNTLDRWYRRAAIVVWPVEQRFANRADASPAWALDQVLAQLKSKQLDDAVASVAALAPFWRPGLGNARKSLLTKALRAAVGIRDAASATILLTPFAPEHLGRTHLTPLAKATGLYGEAWLDAVLGTWFASLGRPGTWTGAGRHAWLEALPQFCTALPAEASGRAVASRLVAASWADVEATISDCLSKPRRSDILQGLRESGPAAAAVLAASVAADLPDVQRQIAERVRRDDRLASLGSTALRASTRPVDHGRNGFGELAAATASHLRRRLAQPARADDDWSLTLPKGCDCELCARLRAFLGDRDRRVLEWPIAKAGRSHLHGRIDRAELPVSHLTRRTGRPYTLVLTKREELFERERRDRERWAADLAWIEQTWGDGLA